jgi:DNA-binding MarR family transcriptional regulator
MTQGNGLPLEQQIVAAIRQIVRAVDLHSRRLVDNYGLTGPQLATLQEAARLQCASPSMIARSVHLSQGTVTGILHRLEARHLIRRRRSETDRRGVIIEVTDAGHAMLDAAPSLLQDHFRAKLLELEEWERLQILSTMQRVATLMGAESIDASPHLISDTVSLPDGGASTVPSTQTDSSGGVAGIPPAPMSADAPQG